ncbi:hypothetical protein LguiA_001842 [Lonicera macranthoides]
MGDGSPQSHSNLTAALLDLIAQCNVQSVSDASGTSAPAVSQGSRPAFLTNFPTFSQGSKSVLYGTSTQPPLPHIFSQPFAPYIPATTVQSVRVATGAQGSMPTPTHSNTPSISSLDLLLPLPTNQLHTSTSSQLTRSPPTKTFASLLKNSNNLNPNILAPIHTPYIKGNLPAIKLDELFYQKAVQACIFNLIGRLTLPKGSSPLKVSDLHSKLNVRWGIKNDFKLTPISRGYFCLRFKNHEDQNQHQNFYRNTINLSSAPIKASAHRNKAHALPNDLVIPAGKSVHSTKTCSAAIISTAHIADDTNPLNTNNIGIQDNVLAPLLSTIQSGSKTDEQNCSPSEYLLDDDGEGDGEAWAQSSEANSQENQEMVNSPIGS